MVSSLKAILLLPVILFGIANAAQHACRTNATNSPLLSDCQVALSLWQDDLLHPEICIRDNKIPLAEYNKCLILGYNIDLSPANPNLPTRNEYCFSKDLVKQTLRYLTGICGLFLPADESPHGNPDVRVEGEYRFDTIDGLETDRYRSIRILNADYDGLEQWADGSVVTPNDWELRRYNWEHRANTFTGRDTVTPGPLPAVTVPPRIRPSVAAALAAKAAAQMAAVPGPAVPLVTPGLA
ncbi:hypothetical protein BJ508DRAFT_76844 [Ascobolus immersus RN42]|uniref:Ecp2 effector protein domain-containing protein n=1 Tax=Ascobolus immersus RN42 TaxID=1160509 RepID=A0A3N4HGM3_ASCIM|nr:hypothetical protein BJ508DRAFT_76844 [Ascobolus immersus RN42]